MRMVVNNSDHAVRRVDPPLVSQQRCWVHFEIPAAVFVSDCGSHSFLQSGGQRCSERDTLHAFKWERYGEGIRVGSFAGAQDPGLLLSPIEKWFDEGQVLSGQLLRGNGSNFPVFDVPKDNFYTGANGFFKAVTVQFDSYAVSPRGKRGPMMRSLGCLCMAQGTNAPETLCRPILLNECRIVL